MIAPLGWAEKYLSAPMEETVLDPSEVLAIRQTLAGYAFALDHADLAVLTDILTRDATWQATIGGDVQQGPFIGRPAILNLVTEATAAQTHQQRHHLTNLFIRGTDANTAVVWAYLSLTSNAEGRPQLVATGFYAITLRRAGDNRWRIAKVFVGLDNAA